MEPFKNKIHSGLIRELASLTRAAWPAFDALEFAKAAQQDLEQMELKARIDHVARRWREYLPNAYPAALKVVLKTLPPEFEAEAGWGDVVFMTWIHSHFVQVFGLDDPEISLKAMPLITKRGTCEFTVRPFLRLHPAKTRAFLKTHLKDPNPHVRRWISEGTRPRLPWGEHLKDVIADPKPNLSLLAALRKDPSLYVRRSVANHLGDIAKDHLKLALDTAETWLQDAHAPTAWLVHHALRYPAKKGSARALRLRARAKKLKNKKG